MFGVLVNVATVLIGSTVGLLFRKMIPQNATDFVMKGIGLCTIYIGIDGALGGTNPLIAIISMAVGALIGALADLDKHLNHFAGKLEERFKNKDGSGPSIAEGFVTASLVYCVGAMAVVGALDSGIRGDHSTLIAKAILDGVTAIVFTSSLGIGVMLSAVPILIYQGSIALLGNAIAPLLSDAVITEMSAVGGLLIMAIGINMVLEKDIKVANLLPAILIPFLYYPIAQLF